MIVEGAEQIVLGRGRVVHGRVVAKADQLYTLKAHDPVRLRPAPVIADAHADQAAERAPHREAQVPHLEVALLEVLERPIGLVLGMAGEMDLPIAPDDLARAIREDGSVEAACAAPLVDELGVAEAEAHAEAARLVEERARLRPRHLVLEEGVDLRLIFHPPAREEGRERELREHHELAATRVGLGEEGEEPLDHVAAALTARDGTELGGADGERAGHGRREPSTARGAIEAGRPTSRTP